MMGADFLLKAMGVSEEAVAELKALLEPEKVKATLNNLRVRFDAMEARNMAMHAMLTELVAKNLPIMGQFTIDGVASGPLFADPLMAEMDRQTQLFEERIEDDGNGSSADGNALTGGQHFNGGN